MRKLLLTLPLCLLACSGPAPEKPSVDLEGLPAFVLRATGDIKLPEPMVMAAFVPNHVAEWAGHILLLSESGDIWRTSSEGDAPVKIAAGPFTDMYGLSRPNKAGVFLALGADGTLSAFTETDDPADFTALAVSQGQLEESGANIKAFCEGPGFASSWLIGTDKNLYAFSAVIKDDMIAEITIDGIGESTSELQSCHAPAHEQVYYQGENGRLYRGKSSDGFEIWSGAEDVSPAGSAALIGFDPKTGAPLLGKDGELYALEIEDGLSIRGASQASFISATSYPLGSVFNKGVILIGDQTEPRLVMIAMEYAERQIANIP